MKVLDAIKKIEADIVNLSDGDREIITGYCGDFLSFVMGKAPQDCCWFTVMTNINVCAVATLADVSLVVLCEGVAPSPELVEKCKTQGVNLAKTKHDVFEAVRRYLNEV
ncbi:MAG: hypothetical protein GX891_00530 [Clostridiales bacterium]|nr:hypothetical protein [Clostridiales bacterium]